MFAKAYMGLIQEPLPMLSPTFRRNLLAWYDTNARDLPWRRTDDPYRIWISEIMLQQTRVIAVLDYYARFLDLFPTVEALAKAKEPDVLAAWSGLGYSAEPAKCTKPRKPSCRTTTATSPKPRKPCALSRESDPTPPPPSLASPTENQQPW